ncbi:Gfo/Idh/MocA family oxidoreductase [Kineosporia sp. J2-2]|uniref:Gfo/Idh/MocA family oxidoreductase n=1 Tax=Kineosporia corallincola TaxID=2835133 RepID=A0ABS5TT69_9ACTN|nr:Gfo/Idh/MocA family oxidoreductase [Kineosporia corallincola]MBT0774016.1 Gfo/Idh/MocA family oxidoreductase [Kineosporia corallincola]
MSTRVVVVGGGFGRVHARAVLARPDRYRLAGVAGRGGAASRELAQAHDVPYFDLSHGTQPAARAADVVCVAVGSAISGGPGTELAQAFLAHGVHVLQEHPLHADELLACARTARAHGVQHRVNLHYRNVPPVRAFIEAARRLTGRSGPVFVDAAAPVHVLHPLLDVLAAALGGVRPWAWHDVTGHGPLRTVTGTLAGVPLTLRVQNQLDPLDRDNHALFWHQIRWGTTSGVLTLADTHGPVLWSPRWHAARDEHHRLVLEGPGAAGLDRPSTATLPGTGPVTMARAMDEWWPQAVLVALDELTAAASAGADPLRQAQLDLTTTRIWSALTTRLGPPDPVTTGAPAMISVDDLVVPDSPDSPDSPDGQDGAPAGYTTEAEFYDLVAGRRSAQAEAVVRALDGAAAEDGPILEIGAGTGILTAAVARARPGARIVAAEPDPVMRAVLTSRVVRDEDLRERVTVTDGAAPGLRLPDRIGAVLVCGVAGHLNAAQRRELWHRLARNLAPGAPLVVELLALDDAADFGPVRLGQARLGEDDVQWWFSARPGPDGSADLTSTWETSRDGAVHRSTTARHTWNPVTLSDVAAESGLQLEVLVAGGTDGAVPLGVLRHPSGHPSQKTHTPETSTEEP